MADLIYREAARNALYNADALTMRGVAILNGLPAVDAELVKHGRWELKHPNGWACSECGEWGLMIDNRGICKSNYCPNCGAKMDLEVTK